MRLKGCLFRVIKFNHTKANQKNRTTYINKQSNNSSVDRNKVNEMLEKLNITNLNNVSLNSRGRNQSQVNLTGYGTDIKPTPS